MPWGGAAGDGDDAVVSGGVVCAFVLAVGVWGGCLCGSSNWAEGGWGLGQVPWSVLGEGGHAQRHYVHRRGVPSARPPPTPPFSPSQVIKSLEPALSLRRLYVVLSVRQQPIILTLLLFSVIELVPSIADVSGGTNISVRGEGFVEDLGCSFRPGFASTATFVDSTVLLCEALPIDANSSNCLSEVGVGPATAA